MDPVRIAVEPRRRRILQLVWNEARTAGDIAAQFPDISFGAVSQHLARLRSAGFVTVRKDGNHRYYRADHDALGPLAPMLQAMWAGFLDDLAASAEADDAS